MEDRILVVDDEPSMLDVLGEFLDALGYAHEQCDRPSTALAKLEGGGYSLLLTDIRMPEMNGVELARRAKDIDPCLTVILITGMPTIEDATEALRAGVNDYVLKPIALAELRQAIETGLERRRAICRQASYLQELEDRVEATTEDYIVANGKLRETKQYLENLLNSTADAITTIGEDGVIQYVNNGAVRMFGYMREEFTGMEAAEWFSGGQEEWDVIRQKLAEAGELRNYEASLRHEDGHVIPVSASFSLVPEAEGALTSSLAICKDITEQKVLEQQLKELSIRDSLSGLFNQRHFYDRLEAELERARRQGRSLGLLLLDIDCFKTYNDRHGHLEGDIVLKDLGKVIRQSTRDHVDLGFRYGGDEFTVILPEAGEGQALQIAERIRSSFQERRFDDLTISVGLMCYEGRHSLKSFIKTVDSLMFDAKRLGGNRVEVYRPGGAVNPPDEPLKESSDA